MYVVVFAKMAKAQKFQKIVTMTALLIVSNIALILNNIAYFKFYHYYNYQAEIPGKEWLAVLAGTDFI